MSADSYSVTNQMLQVELNFLQALLRRMPSHLRILEGLLHFYTQWRLYHEAMSVAQHIVTLIPDNADAWYNLATCYAVTDRRDEAIASLSRAITLGYHDYKWMSMDGELQTLRNDPHFKKLFNKVRQLAHLA